MTTESKTTQVQSTTPEGLKVAVVRGGTSAERKISLKTGSAVVQALESRPCEVLEYDVSSQLGEILEADQVDVVFLALHGKGGEDGTVQAMLKWREIPFTGPGYHASALCMDKLRTRQLFDQLEVPGPDWYRLRRSETVRNKKNFSRMVVKPRSEGSSLGVSIVDESHLQKAVDQAREFDDDVIVEEYVDGYEITVGVVTTDDLNILPPVGIRPDHEFFDYDSKYTKGLTKYDVPAELSSSVLEQAQSLASKIAREAETRSLCRVDLLLDTNGTFRLLEINTIPGLTETSLLPMAASEVGIEFEDLIWQLTSASLRDSRCQRE